MSSPTMIVPNQPRANVYVGVGHSITRPAGCLVSIADPDSVGALVWPYNFDRMGAPWLAIVRGFFSLAMARGPRLFATDTRQRNYGLPE